jgi:hypothetical protein
MDDEDGMPSCTCYRTQSKSQELAMRADVTSYIFPERAFFGEMAYSTVNRSAQ